MNTKIEKYTLVVIDDAGDLVTHYMNRAGQYINLPENGFNDLDEALYAIDGYLVDTINDYDSIEFIQLRYNGVAVITLHEMSKVGTVWLLHAYANQLRTFTQQLTTQQILTQFQNLANTMDTGLFR